MKQTTRILTLGLAVALCSSALADDYTFKVVARGLARPTGILSQTGETLYFTEIPTPTVGGGLNGVKALNLRTGAVRVIHQGEPEPTNLAADRHGNLYWTCKSAGVILEQSPSKPQSTAVAVLKDLAKPSGVAVDRWGDIYYTQVPTPGQAGGQNSVSVFDGTVSTVLHVGEPEPTDIVVARDGDLYWTCKSAGVILKQDNDGITTVLVKDLQKPTGIAIDRQGRNLYWTEVPTPGVAGTNGGTNKVVEMNLRTKITNVVHLGDPEPTDVTVSRNGNLYWTCSSAGVIIEAKEIKRRKNDNDREDNQ